jgi:hypothetical protein
MAKNIVKAKEEQKFIWLARILVIFVSIGLISNAILVWTFLKIMPNTKVQPIYIRAKNIDDKDIYITKNINNMLGNLPVEEQGLYNMKFEQPGYYMAQNIIKKYIIDRESFDPNSDYVDIIWGENSDVKFMSADDIYKKFVSEKILSASVRATKKIAQIIDAPAVVDELSSNPEWIASISIKEFDKSGRIVRSEQKRVRVQGYFDPQKFIRNEKVKYKNPLGFIITKYSVE